MKDLKTIYITKYALTNGILVENAEIKGDMAITIKDGCFPMYLHGHGREWHTTKESAIARAEEMKIKRLMALDKQIKRISNLNFEII